LRSSGPGDQTYKNTEQALTALGQQRDPLAARMGAALAGAAAGHPIDEGDAKHMIDQGNGLLDQARALASQPS
jgi:hypothetical protein